MLQNKILQQLEKNQKNFSVGGEVFNIEIPENEIKRGKSFEEIVEKMKKASNEDLIRVNKNASFC